MKPNEDKREECKEQKINDSTEKKLNGWLCDKNEHKLLIKVASDYCPIGKRLTGLPHKCWKVIPIESVY